MSKKFLILEVKEAPDAARLTSWGNTEQWVPMDFKYGEIIRLHPSRIIDGDRLRYGTPSLETYLYVDGKGHVAWIGPASTAHKERLILDPAKPEQTDLDHMIDQAPACIGSKAKAWVKDSLIPFIQESVTRNVPPTPGR